MKFLTIFKPYFYQVCAIKTLFLPSVERQITFNKTIFIIEMQGRLVRNVLYYNDCQHYNLLFHSLFQIICNILLCVILIIRKILVQLKFAILNFLC